MNYTITSDPAAREPSIGFLIFCAGFNRIKAMAEVRIKIEGMSCQHCVMRVKQALEGLEGVSEAHVEIGAASVRYDESRLGKKDMEAVVKKAGYKATPLGA